MSFIRGVGYQQRLLIRQIIESANGWKPAINYWKDIVSTLSYMVINVLWHSLILAVCPFWKCYENVELVGNTDIIPAIKKRLSKMGGDSIADIVLLSGSTVGSKTSTMDDLKNELEVHQ